MLPIAPDIILAYSVTKVSFCILKTAISSSPVIFIFTATIPLFIKGDPVKPTLADDAIANSPTSWAVCSADAICPF